jgi:uncharacterized membrane protein required for colicin V production
MTGQSMSLDQLPFNLFDVVVLLVLAAGLLAGRKHGMSEELLSLLKWLAIVFVCGTLYPVGADLIGQFTRMFSKLTCYLIAYIGGALIIYLVFVWLKRGFGGKLLGSDIFGRSEYYLGMGAGLVRFSCILIAGLAILNSRYFNPTEVRAMEKFQDDVYGSNFFPTLHSLQSTVFDRSLTGPFIKQYLGNLLIEPTAPQQNDLHQKEFALPGS